MKIDAFAHILPPRYAERVFELLRARGDTSATDYARMMGLDATLTDLGARFRLMDELGNDYRQVRHGAYLGRARASRRRPRSRGNRQ